MAAPGLDGVGLLPWPGPVRRELCVPIIALQRLAMDGLREGLQNRMPLAWSSLDSRVSKITGWTVRGSEPAGNPGMASAILDLWTYGLMDL